jgi:hypothetical protein
MSNQRLKLPTLFRGDSIPPQAAVAPPVHRGKTFAEIFSTEGLIAKAADGGFSCHLDRPLEELVQFHIGYGDTTEEKCKAYHSPLISFTVSEDAAFTYMNRSKKELIECEMDDATHFIWRLEGHEAQEVHGNLQKDHSQHSAYIIDSVTYLRYLSPRHTPDQDLLKRALERAQNSSEWLIYPTDPMDDGRGFKNRFHLNDFLFAHKFFRKNKIKATNPRFAMTFPFKELTERYYREITETRHPRLKAWEYLWVYRKTTDDTRELVDKGRIELTALQLGFYLANWGMFRGSGHLLYKNYEFFCELSILIFNKIPLKFPDFYKREFLQYADNESAVREFDEVTEFMQNNLDISMTDTLWSKILLGVWGQCPAYDDYFLSGLKEYLRKEGGSVKFTEYTKLSGGALKKLAKLCKENNWDKPDVNYLTTVLSTDRKEQVYPLAKIIDMAFWQYGSEILRNKDGLILV